ncbi:class I SAM-dependent methyltransferase [Winogradskyella pulchriflava]|uniref:Class I SAM-dependent methyltransferase n=1 Tax=Winogradskyella pulchriflava TaxID=1110688 RepID=A0ABV6Q6H8_9FLAO
MKKKSKKTPWPTKDVMRQIYEKHFWGGKAFDFYSGEGSHTPEIIQPYIASVSDFLSAHNKALTVCDLGCGDFNVGKHLTKHTKTYIAIDIVESLIERNKTLFKEDNLEFRCLDIVEDELPQADCIILRQVLQHISNSEILQLIQKLINYKYIILTEHLPVGNFEPNKDKITSQGIRLKQQSGVDILAEPFNLKVKSAKVLHEIILNEKKGRIVTMLYRL